MVSIFKVHFRETLRALDPVLQFLHKREGVVVRYHYLIEHLVIYTELAAPSVRLGDEEEQQTCLSG